MLHASENGCVCSSCFTRNYELYDGRTWAGRKKSGLKLLDQPTAEQTERARQMWRKHLQRRTRRRKAGVQAKLILRQKKTLKKIEEEIEIVNILKEIQCSEVFLESPTSADDRMPIMNLTTGNFWDFVYQHHWKGRIRVCEGELMYKITETFKKLVSMKVIADFNVTRLFAAESKKDEFEDDIPIYKSQHLTFVVRVDQTYYGGMPRKAKKMVTFNLVPNSVFMPRLNCISPILKRHEAVSSTLARGKSPSVSRVEEKVSNFGSNNRINCARNSNQWEKVSLHPVTKDDFASICLKATQDFVAVKEMITNSRTLKTSTSFTIRRKEGLSGTNEIAVTMKDFYTSSNLPEHSYDTPEFKRSTPLLEMKI